MREKSTLPGKKHLKKYSQKLRSISVSKMKRKETSRKQHQKWKNSKSKKVEKLAEASCQRLHQRSIYSSIYRSARGEHLCLVTSERQLPFQCCLIKTSQAAPLDCFDAWGPIVHKNQWLDRWGRGAVVGSGEEGAVGGESWRRNGVCVCVWGGSEEALCRGIREGRETTKVLGRPPHAASLFLLQHTNMTVLDTVVSPLFVLQIPLKSKTIQTSSQHIKNTKWKRNRLTYMTSSLRDFSQLGVLHDLSDIWSYENKWVHYLKQLVPALCYRSRQKLMSTTWRWRIDMLLLL